MKFHCNAAILASICLGTTSAFTTTPSSVQTVVIPSTSTTSLFADKGGRIQNAGCGIPLVQSGNKLLFDPSEEGMLGGTASLDDRLSTGTNYVYHSPTYLADHGSASDVVDPDMLIPCQAWLENTVDGGVFAKTSQPVTAQVLGRGKLITDDAPGDIQHVVMKLPEGFHYLEGQSLSVIPPGIDSKTGKPHKARLYSIASTRYGDLGDGSTVSLCVRRAEYYDPATGQVDPSKAGVCSGYLCDIQPGTPVQVAGPVGKTMLLPQDPTADVIMVATGTGIAPFRAFLHRLFVEDTTAKHMFQGQAWLILGVPVTGGLLYKQELDSMLTSSDPGQLRIDYAISREMQNASGGKMYVQDTLKENADELFSKLEAGAHIYFCGLKGMMPGILDALEEVATSKGLDWKTTLTKYKSNKQWHVEVY